MSADPLPAMRVVESGGSVSDDGHSLAQELVRIGEGSVSGVLLFGSQLVQASPDRHSAYDLIVLVDSYPIFYRRFAAAGHHRRPPWLLTILARILAPNVIAFFPGGPDGLVAKCMILTVRDFEKSLTPKARDHFLKGRMVQRVAMLYARDSEVTDRVDGAVAGARDDVLRWVGPALEGPFDARSFARTMLQVSYGGEVRPESRDRVSQVFEAQADALEVAFQPVLEKAEAEGKLLRDGPGWRLARPVGALRAARVRVYFVWSKARATSRWFKHMFTFNDWLTYIQRKIERRTGMKVEITDLERRYPLILLWPKVVRVLRARPPEQPNLSAPVADE